MTVISGVLTALAILGFALAPNFWVLCAWSIPYGLGAGSVDVALNNYVALHFKSTHMNWLHCSWGIGATIGPLHHGDGIIWRGKLAGRILVCCLGTAGNHRSIVLEFAALETP